MSDPRSHEALWSRRSALGTIGAAVGVGLAGGLVARFSAAADQELVIVDSGGTTSEAHKALFYDPFSKETGIKVRVVSTSSSPEAFAKLRAASKVGQVEWDVVSTSRESMLTQRDLLVPVPCNELSNWTAQGLKGGCVDYGLLKFGYGELIAYNNKKFPPGTEPKTWADFWDVKKFPGPRAFSNVGTPWELLTVALMADGVPAETSKLYPLDVDRGFKKLDQIKPHVAVWYKTGAQQQQILKDEEVVMAFAWSGRALTLKAAGVPVDVQWNQAIVAADFWSIAKDAPHPKAAVAFLNYFAGQPQAHAAFARRTSYFGPNAKTEQFLEPKERVAPPASATTVQMDFAWIAQHRDALINRFNTWLAG
jgi:mannopine transport system substrate-binding protein